MSIEKNVQVVKDFFAAMGSGDMLPSFQDFERLPG